MSAPIHRSSTVAVAGSGGSVVRVGALLVLLLLAAIAKPWSSGAPSPASAPPAPGVMADDGPTPATSAAGPVVLGARDLRSGAIAEPSLGPDELRCLGRLEVVSLVHLGGWNIREWRPVDAIQADSALDPALDPGFDVVRLDGGPVRALGVCEGSEGNRPQLRLQAVWRLTGLGATRSAAPMPIVELARPDAGLEEQGVLSSVEPLARLYRPAHVASGSDWPVGIYALQIGLVAGSSRDGARATGGIEPGWLGITIGSPAP